MTLVSKVGVISTLSAIIASSSAITSYSLTPKFTKIKEEIENDGKKLLNNDSKHWTIKLSTYKKFEKDIHLNTKDEKGLMEWCLNTIQTNFKNKKDTKFSIAKKLCTTPNYEEKLISNLKELPSKGDWKKLSEEYNKSATDKNIIAGINKGEGNRKNLRDWCKKTFKKEVLEDDNIYNTLVTWCTINK